MPELSNSFQAGKMNKDADERMVSSGEYRNALNIQVTTSEGSHVGTAQSVLGNRKITNLLSGTLHTVGHIVDEKVDRIIRMVSKPFHENNPIGADYIMEYNSKGDVETPVAVDIYKVKTTTTSTIGAAHTVHSQTITISLGTAVSSWIRVGMKVTAETAAGVAISGYQAVDRLVVKSWNGTVITLEREGGGDTVTTGGAIASGDVFYFESERYLEFEDNENYVLITGINLIDDLLFWTDNKGLYTGK